ncbi:MAG: hypothetical protein ACOC1K_07350, partial [Nanoarchaeota archaeon]
MVNTENLLERIAEISPETSSYIDNINLVADKIINRIYQPTDYKIISHLADADGLCSEIILNLGMQFISEFYGGMNNVTSSRIMRFSKEKNSPDNLAST